MPLHELPERTLRCSIAYNTHGAYCVPDASRHRPAAQTILAGEVWEPNILALFTDAPTPRDIVHAGTFFGDFLPALARSCTGGAQVWAFEPNPENARCADLTCRLNQLDNVQLMHAGLGETNGRGVLRTLDASGRGLGGASRFVAQPKPDTKVVPVVTIDDVIPANRDVGVIQLDVEGAELCVLRGALATIRRCRPVLILEAPRNTTSYTSGFFADDILSLGYEPLGFIHENALFFPQETALQTPTVAPPSRLSWT